LPWFTALARWADNHPGAEGVYGVKQVIVVDRIAERLQMAGKTAPI
jgi:DNA-binding ferritin-like protein